MDAGQEQALPVGIERPLAVDGGGCGPPGRVGDADGAGDGEDRRERARQQQRRPDAEVAGQSRNGERGEGPASG
jgi:hypothetical protein